jgi:hypothetical protein
MLGCCSTNNLLRRIHLLGGSPLLFPSVPVQYSVMVGLPFDVNPTVHTVLVSEWLSPEMIQANYAPFVVPKPVIANI